MEHSSPDLLASLTDGETLYQDAPCGYFSCLPDGKIIKINRTLLRWLQYDESELVGQFKFTDLLSKGGHLYFQMFHYPLIKLKRQVNELSYDIYRKNGTFFPALVNTLAINDLTGELLAFNVAVTDITDRKSYETELLNAKRLAEAEKSRFEFVSDFIPEMIWTAEGDGKINYVNRRFSNYFNLSGKSTDLQQIIALIFPADRLSTLRSWISGIRSKHDFELRLRLKDPSGQYAWYLLKGLPFQDENGVIERWLGSCSNIENHIRELEKRDEFVSVTSHELKTPLTGLKASLQVLERTLVPELPPIFAKMVGQSIRNANKISGFIDELLNVTRLNEGQLTLKKQSFDLVELARDCIGNFPTEIIEKLRFSGLNTLPIMADQDRVEQVIVNYISNAIKYAPASEIIELIIEVLENTVRLSVKDKGPGIVPEKIPHLFERYYRADHSGSPYSGLGLGLYICAEIIKKHHGKTGVASELGKGSTFWFTLPLKS